MIKQSDLIRKHEGKMGFVLGAGPSLHHADVSRLKPYVTVAVNSAISKARFADYFLADDIGVKHWNYYQQILPTLDTVSLLYHGKLKNDWQHLDREKICWFTHKTWFEPSKNKYHEDGLVLTADTGPIIGARTAAGSAVHFLYLMGCDPIVLLGCDCCYEGDRRYFWQFPGEDRCFRLNGEKVWAFPNAGFKNGKPYDSHSRDFLAYWQALAAQAKKQNVNIISVSGGLLDSFPRKSLDDVLTIYGERVKSDRGT